MTSLYSLKRKSRDVAEMARKVVKKLKEEVEKKKPSELRQHSKEEGVAMADCVDGDFGSRT